VFEFSKSRDMFYPGFCEAKEIRMMRVDDIRGQQKEMAGEQIEY